MFCKFQVCSKVIQLNVHRAAFGRFSVKKWQDIVDVSERWATCHRCWEPDGDRAGWPQADLKLHMCSRGREFNWGETNMQSQDLELEVVRAGVRQRERWRLVPGFGAWAPGQMVSVDWDEEETGSGQVGQGRGRKPRVLVGTHLKCPLGIRVKISNKTLTMELAGRSEGKIHISQLSAWEVTGPNKVTQTKHILKF